MRDIKHNETTIAILGIVVLCCWLIACRQEKIHDRQSFVEFPEIIECKGRAITPDTALLRYPFRIRIQGDKIAILDLHGSDYFCHLFHYPDFHYLTSWARRGKGPDEQLSVENIRWEGDSIWILDSYKSELKCFVYKPDTRLMECCSRIALDSSLSLALDFVQCGTDSFAIPDYSGQHRLSLVNKTGIPIQNVGTIPTAHVDLLKQAPAAMSQAWRCFIDYQPRQDILAAATQFGEVLEIYHLKDTLRTITIGQHGEPKFKLSDGYGIPNGIMGCFDIQITSNAIYVVFQGHSFQELIRNYKVGIRLPDGGSNLYVFTLEGKPIRHYRLDHSVCGISVDESAGTVLATDVNNDNAIVEFRIHEKMEITSSSDDRK